MSKEMLELADEIEYCVERGIDAHLTAKSLTIISAALRASAVAEPVAWRVDGIRDGKQQVWFYWKPEWPGMHEEQGDMVTPLYAHPAPAVAEPVAGMTIDSIEQHYKAWRGALTVFERPSHQDAFREGYVVGWNDRESFHPAPAAPDPTNHHNALKCPYCNPNGLTFAEPAAPVPASVREALDNSQSLLLMINHMGSDRPTGIASLDWDNEDLSKLTAEQIAENRSALASLPTPGAVPMREEIIEQPLTAEFTKSLPGGALDDSTYSQIEDALDAIDAPMTDNGRYMTLVERILALKSAPAKPHHVALGSDLDDGQRGKERE